jgi:REP element-mobilizing transposase RayT
MPRKKFFPTDSFPYHVTARSHNREWFDLPLIDVWDIFSRYLYFITLAYGVRVHSFVLMSNHFHMLITTPNANLDQAMNYLMREVSKAIGRESGKINQVFGGPYHWSVIKNRVYYEFAYKYVYRNPVEASLVRRVENYPYSTLRGILGLDPLPFPAFDNMNLIAHPARCLSWLNSPYPHLDLLDDIRQGLRQREFQIEL